MSFAYDAYTGLPYAPTFANVRREAFLLSAGDVVWNGKAFPDDQAGELVR